MDIYGVNQDQFAKMLGPWLGRPVVNNSGLEGLFEFHLEYAIDETLPDVLPTSLRLRMNCAAHLSLPQFRNNSGCVSMQDAVQANF